MKIDPNASLPEGISSQRVEQPSSTVDSLREKGEDLSKGVQDLTQLSVDQGKINQLQAQIAQLPDVRQERVEALRLALQQGTYQASNDQIAEAILSELSESKLLDK